MYNYTGKRQSMNAIPGRKAEGEVVVFVSGVGWGGVGGCLGGCVKLRFHVYIIPTECFQSETGKDGLFLTL